MLTWWLRELGQKPLRVPPEEPPVEEVVEGGIAPARGIVARGGRVFLAPPGAVAVPDETRVVDVAQQARLDDALVGGLVDRVVEALVADLEEAAASSAPPPACAGSPLRPRPSSSRTGRACPPPGSPTVISACSQRGGARTTASRSSFCEHLLPVVVVAWPAGFPALARTSSALARWAGLMSQRARTSAKAGSVCARRHAALAAEADEAQRAPGPPAHGALERGRRAEGQPGPACPPRPSGSSGVRAPAVPGSGS